MRIPLDYLCFLCGILLLLQYVLTYSRRLREAAEFRFRLFGWFCLIAGVQQWMQLLCASYPALPYSDKLNLLLSLASFVVLLEFGRTALWAQGMRVPRWGLVPLLLLAFSSLRLGMSSFAACASFVLAAPGAMLAALAFAMAARKSTGWQRRGFVLAGVGMVVFGLAALLSVPEVRFLVENLPMRQAPLWQGQDVSLWLLLVSAAVALLGLWTAARSSRRRPAVYIWNAATPLLLLVVLTAGWWSAHLSGGLLDEEIGASLLAEANSLAASMNPSDLKGLTFTRADQQDARFRRLHEQFQTYLPYTSARGIYMVAQRNGQLVFGPQSYNDNDQEASAPGTPFVQPPAGLEAVFRTRTARSVAPYQKQSGTYVSAYAPVEDPHTGKMLLAVGMDVATTDWQIQVLHFRLAAIGFTLLFIVLYLTITLLLQYRQERPPSGWPMWMRYLESAVVLACGLSVTLAVALILNRFDMRFRAEVFRQMAGVQAARLRQTFVDLDNQVDSVGRFCETRSNLSREDFTYFVRPLVQSAAIQAYEWIPAVPAAQKARVEAAIQRQNTPGYTIFQRNAKGEPEPASGRTVYYPVAYVEPRAGNERAVGFDLGSEPMRRSALDEAARSQTAVATNPITLVQETERQKGLLVFRPVYTTDANGQTQLRGFALFVIRLQSLFSRMLSDASTALTADLVELNTKHEPEMLATTRKDRAEGSANLRSRFSKPDLVLMWPVLAYGKTYATVIRPGPDFSTVHARRTGWQAFFLGLALSTIAAAFVGNLGWQRYSLNTEVEARTSELQRSETRYRLLFENSLSGVALLEAVRDPQGSICDWLLLAANATFGSQLGRRREEILGRPISAMLSEQDAATMYLALRMVVDDLRPITFEEHFARQKRDCLVNVFPAGAGRVAYISVDITDRKRAEQALRKTLEDAGRLNQQLEAETARANASATEAQAATAAKSMFLANMSHEIRTPLNGVIGLNALLLDMELSPKQRHYAELIGANAGLLLQLINDILDLSKLEAGKLQLESAKFELRPLLSKLAKMMEFPVSEKGLRFVCQAEGDVPERLCGDSGRLQQVLINLVGNAIKFTKQGEVVVNVTRQWEEAGLIRLRFSVRDTGIGIPREQQQLVFASFTQADSSTTRKFGGTGLGLTICKELVGIMGGQIGVESEPGQGSEFWFTATFHSLPDMDLKLMSSKKRSGLLQLPMQQVPAAGYPARILLVEDNLTNQQVALGILGKMNLHADTAANGVQALEALSRQHYDLVLMDVQMPEMDGMEATRQIRSSASTVLDHEVPIVAMTAHAMAGDEARCLGVGMNDYVTKPIDPRLLLAAIRRWLPAEIPAQPSVQSSATGMPTAEIVFDHADFVRRMMDDSDLAQNIAVEFLSSLENDLRELQRMMQAGDVAAVGKMAHRIKGAAGNVSAVRLARTAANLESDCKTGASTHPEALVEALARQCAELRATMEKWMNPGAQ